MGNEIFTLNDVRMGYVETLVAYRNLDVAVEEAFKLVKKRQPDALDSKMLRRIKRAVKTDGYVTVEATMDGDERIIQVCRAELDPPVEPIRA